MMDWSESGVRVEQNLTTKHSDCVANRSKGGQNKMRKEGAVTI